MNLFIVGAIIIIAGGMYLYYRKPIVYSATSDILKNLVGALLAALCPLLYSIITSEYPSFSDVISMENFTALITWLIYAIFWGASVYNLAKAGATAAYRQFSKLK